MVKFWLLVAMTPSWLLSPPGKFRLKSLVPAWVILPCRLSNALAVRLSVLAANLPFWLFNLPLAFRLMVSVAVSLAPWVYKSPSELKLISPAWVVLPAKSVGLPVRLNLPVARCVPRLVRAPVVLTIRSALWVDKVPSAFNPAASTPVLVLFRLLAVIVVAPPLPIMPLLSMAPLVKVLPVPPYS